MRRAGQHQVKQPGVILAGIVGGNRPLFLLDNPLQVIDIGAGGHFGGKSGDIALQQLAGLQDFERPDVAAQHLFFLAIVLVRDAHHVHPGALANVDRPLQLQHQQRFADDGPAHAVGLGDIAFRRQARPDGIAPLRNLCA